jgi:NADP-dependent 3-hydroxy acid dehydrogenase YdfG
MAEPTWIILGASSGIARAFANEAARHGAAVILAGRDADDIARTAADIGVRTGRPAVTVMFDALDIGSHAGFAAYCAELCSGPMNLFLAFGAMPSQSESDGDPAMARLTVETNFLGAVAVLSAFAPFLEQRGEGTVMALGSVAGDRGRIGNYLYGATKAALHVYLQGYRARLSRSGIRVVVLKAGPVDTSMTWPLPRLPFMISPESFARLAWRLTEKGPVTAYVPRIWQAVMTCIRLIPTPVFNKLDI